MLEMSQYFTCGRRGPLRGTCGPPVVHGPHFENDCFKVTDLIQQRCQLVLEVSQLVEWGSVCSECVSSDCSITTPVSGRSIHWSVFSNQYSWLLLHHEDQRSLQATQRKGY